MAAPVFVGHDRSSRGAGNGRQVSPGGRTERWAALALCAAVLLGVALENLVRGRPGYAQIFAPDWVPFAAVGFGVAGVVGAHGSARWLRARRTLLWGGLLAMVWVANGLPFDLLRVVRLIPLDVDWPGLVTRTLALAAAVALARLALERPAHPGGVLPAGWYGYAAFALALPYPVLRTVWALGGTIGLFWAGAAGRGFAPWLLSIPWLLAAAMSLMLVSPPRWMPRRLLLAAGFSATALVGMIGPAACWALVTALARGETGSGGIAMWVFCLIYGSWLLWAIAAGAATRSCQLRTAPVRIRGRATST